jgi:hypothetical protein
MERQQMSERESGSGESPGAVVPPPAESQSELWSPLEAEIVALLRSSGVVLNPDASLQRGTIVDTVRQLIGAYKAEIEARRADEQLIKQLAGKLSAKL